MSEPYFQETTPVPGRRHEIRDGLTVGRTGTDIEVVDPQVSREHLKIHVDGSSVSVEDLGSRNGSFVNEVALSGSTQLSEGDNLRMGDTIWRFYAGQESGVTMLAPSGDVPAPDPSPSGVRAFVLPDPVAPPDFSTPGRKSRRKRGSAARRLGATIYSYGVVIATAAAVAIYLSER